MIYKIDFFDKNDICGKYIDSYICSGFILKKKGENLVLIQQLSNIKNKNKSVFLIYL